MVSLPLSFSQKSSRRDRSWTFVKAPRKQPQQPHKHTHSFPWCKALSSSAAPPTFFSPNNKTFLNDWVGGNIGNPQTAHRFSVTKSIATNSLKFSKACPKPKAGHLLVVRHRSSKALTHVVNSKHMSNPIHFSGTSHKFDVKQGQKWLVGTLPLNRKPLPERLNISMHIVPGPFYVNGYLKIMITRTSVITGTVGDGRLFDEHKRKQSSVHPNGYDSHYQVLFLCFLGQLK